MVSLFDCEFPGLLLEGAAGELGLHHIQRGDDPRFGLSFEEFDHLLVQIDELAGYGDFLANHEKGDQRKIHFAGQLALSFGDFSFGENDLVTPQLALLLEAGGDRELLGESDLVVTLIFVVSNAVALETELQLGIFKTTGPA